jgi:hypothetical protein
MDNIEPKEKDGTYTAQEFAQAYQELCEKYKFRIVVSPTYIARDDNTFSTVLNYTIGQLPAKETK